MSKKTKKHSPTNYIARLSAWIKERDELESRKPTPPSFSIDGLRVEVTKDGNIYIDVAEGDDGSSCTLSADDARKLQRFLNDVLNEST